MFTSLHFKARTQGSLCYKSKRNTSTIFSLKSSLPWLTFSPVLWRTGLKAVMTFWSSERDTKCEMGKWEESSCFTPLCHAPATGCCVQKNWKAANLIQEQNCHHCFTWTLSTQICLEKQQEGSREWVNCGMRFTQIALTKPFLPHLDASDSCLDSEKSVQCCKRNNVGAGRSEKLLWSRQGWKILFALPGSPSNFHLSYKDVWKT